MDPAITAILLPGAQGCGVGMRFRDEGSGCRDVWMKFGPGLRSGLRLMDEFGFGVQGSCFMGVSTE